MTTKRNRVRCRKCGDVIESLSVHDWVACKCWDNDKRTGIFTDGGPEYAHRGAFDMDDIEEVPDDLQV